MKAKANLQRLAITWNTIGIAVYMGLQWLTTIAAVRLGSYTQAGYLSLAMSVTTVFMTLAMFNIRTYQASDLSEKFSSGQYIAHRLLTCGAALLLCIVMVALSGYGLEQTLSILFFMAFRLTESLVDVLHGVDQQQNRLDIVGKSFVLRGIASFIGFIAPLYLTGRVSVAIACMGLASLLVILAYDIPQTQRLRGIRPSWDMRSIKALTLACFSLFVYSLLSNATLAFPKYILDRIYGPEALGIYSSITTPTMIISVMANMLISPVITLLSRAFAGKSATYFWRILAAVGGILLIIGIVCVILSLILGEWGLALLFNEEIVPYAYLLPLVFVTTMIFAANKVVVAALTVLRRTRAVFISGAIGGAISIILSPLLIRAWNMDGANAATFLALFLQFAYMAVYCIVNRKTLFAQGGEIA